MSSGFHLNPLAEAFDRDFTVSNWSVREEELKQQASCLENKGLIDSLTGGCARMGLTFTISKQITNGNNQWILPAVAAFLCKVTDEILVSSDQKRNNEASKEIDACFEPFPWATAHFFRLFAWITREKINMSENQDSSLCEHRLQHDELSELFGARKRRRRRGQNSRIYSAGGGELRASVTVLSVLSFRAYVRRRA